MKLGPLWQTSLSIWLSIKHPFKSHTAAFMCLSSIQTTNFRFFLGHRSPWTSNPSTILLQCPSSHPFRPPSRLQIRSTRCDPPPTWRNRVALFRAGSCNIVLFVSAFVWPLLFFMRRRMVPPYHRLPILRASPLLTVLDYLIFQMALCFRFLL